MIQLLYSAATDTGKVRPANEDSFYAKPPLFVVADGMGGAQAGEVASDLTAKAFAALDIGSTDPERELERVTRAANEAVHQKSQEPTHAGMGTTVTAALVSPGRVSFAHVGDSRAYHFRAGKLRQVSEDHSLVAELMRRGELTQQQAEVHPQRSIITRAVGTHPKIEVDTFSINTVPGDRFLLCSDGLTGMLSDTEIETILKEKSTLDGTVKRLIDQANRQGGNDNITVVLFEIIAVDQDGEATGGGLRRTQRLAQRKKPRIFRRVMFSVLAAVTLLFLAAGVAFSQSYFIGMEQGRFAIYQGFPYELAPGMRLYRLDEVTLVEATALPEFRRNRLLNHELLSRDEARSLIEGAGR